MLHEAVFALGGHPGVLFTDSGTRSDFVKQLHPSERALMQRITNIAGDYGSLKWFIERHTGRVGLPDSSVTELSVSSEHPGVYLHSFCRALNDSLESYREDISALEKEILQDPNVTLSHVAYRAEKYAMLFTCLNRILKQLMLENIRGCQILGFLSRQLASGVDEVKEALTDILSSCHIYFYKQLTSWLLYGHLMDDYKEFFIQSLGESSATSVSQAKSEGTMFTDESADSKNLYPAFYNFGIAFKLLPPYIPATVAYKILFTGQTVLMFGNNPDEKNDLSSGQNQAVSVWSGKEEEFLHKLQELQQLPRFDLNKFEITINEIRTCVTEHLWQVAREKAELFQQLKLIKDFFLLGRGELFLEFIRLLEPILSRSLPIATNREVNQAFQIAARKVLLTDESALDKFYFIVQGKGNSGAQGKTENLDIPNWKRLYLCYRVSWPLHLLFTTEVIELYNRLFKFLLRVKKVQADLHSMWMKQIKTCRADDGNILHPTVRQLNTGFIFLVDNLQYYLQADVLESQYTQMQSAIQHTQDFEKVQQAHAVFQANILSQTFLHVASAQTDSHWQMKRPLAATTTGGAERPKRHPVYSSLSRILALCEMFCDHMRLWDTEELSEQQEDALTQMEEEFNSHLHFLLELLFSLRSEPCGEHLSQLLLRLDFNRWFSRNSNFKPPSNINVLAASSSCSVIASESTHSA